MQHGGIWLHVAARDTLVPLLAGPAAVFAPKLDATALPAWVLLPYDRSVATWDQQMFTANASPRCVDTPSEDVTIAFNLDEAKSEWHAPGGAVLRRMAGRCGAYRSSTSRKASKPGI